MQRPRWRLVKAGGLSAVLAAGLVAWGPAGSAQDPLRWQVGDVFVGVQESNPGSGIGEYLVLRPTTNADGSMGMERIQTVEVPTTSGLTTGCAVDWFTGRLYTTDFDSVVSEIDETGVRRQLFTPRLASPQDPPMSPDNWISWAPESIVFSGDPTTRRFYVGHVEGLFETSPYLADLQGSYDSLTPVAEDGLSSTPPRLWPQALPNAALPPYGDGTLRNALVTRSRTAAPVPGERRWYFVLDYSAGTQRFVTFEATESTTTYTAARIGAGGFLETTTGDPIVDASGARILARPQWGKDLHGYDAAMDNWEASARYFQTAYGRQGTDWIDLAADQRTLYYTSEANVIYRFDVGAPGSPPRQLPPFAQLDPRLALFGLRLLPPGDGSGGLLVAGGIMVYRLDAMGRVVQTYDVPETGLGPASEDNFFSVSLAPDAKTFWTASQRPDGKDWLYQFEVRSGKLLRAVPLERPIGGLCVKLEYTAAREPCDGRDNDGDGVVDNNCPPAAQPDTYSTDEDRPLVVTTQAEGVLANDTDPDGDPLEAVLESGPPHGSLTLNPDGTFTYTPAPDFHGTDTFTYRVREPAIDGSVATVTITVRPVNDAPVARDDAYTTSRGVALSVSAPGVLGNDGDVDGDPLSAALESGPSHGTVTLAPDGAFVYTPNPGFAGLDAFTYRASDGMSRSAPATVRLTVIENQPPVCTATASPALLWPPDHRMVPIRIDGLVDPDGDALSVRVTSIYQDEPTNTDGDGHHTPDGEIVERPDGSSYAKVRAERAGTPKVPGDGRVYHISFTAQDGRGGPCVGEVTVGVPHDRSRPPVDGGPLYDSTVTDPPLRPQGKPKDRD